ncbi:MAG: hypothetical protein JWQ22_515 [Devosia sp.]|nr:hypothetical protein [Devosia sp.]
MTGLKWPPKKPHDILDYAVDWSGTLRGETIDGSAFHVPHGLVKLSEKADKTRTQLWVTGGEDGHYYVIANRICTSGGRVVEEHITLSVIDDIFPQQESS